MYFINVLGHSVEEFLPSFPNARGRITWRDMLCMTPLKAGLPVAVRQLFPFIAVAASEIVTVIDGFHSDVIKLLSQNSEVLRILI